MTIHFSKSSLFLPEQQQLLTDYFIDQASPAFIPKSIINQLALKTSLTDIAIGLLDYAAQFAITPISQFSVGAVAFDSQYNAYCGANFEFSHCHIGQTIHAEQSAIAHAWSLGASNISLLAVTHPPCGHCRQFINETCLTKDFGVILPSKERFSLKQLLPQSFGPSDLNVSEKILSQPLLPPNHPNQPTDLKSLATQACKVSHAPYSQSPSGIAIQFSDHSYALGSYAESAAFNPSLPPLQVALNHRRLLAKDWRKIQQIVMVEENSLLSQKHNTEELLRSFSPVKLDYYKESPHR